MSVDKIRKFIEVRVADITEDLFSTIPYEREKSKYQALLELYFSDIVTMVFENKCEDVSYDLLFRYLKKMCDYSYISKRLLLESVELLIQELIEFSDDKSVHSGLTSIMATMQHYIHFDEIDTLQREIMESNRKNWFIPSFIMDLINGRLDMREQMMHIMKRLQAMGVKSAYLFFFGDAIIYKKEERMQFPEEIYLTAHFDEEKMTCYKAKELIPVRRDNGFVHLLPQDRPHFYTAYPIFSGEEQYGLILCEAEQKEYLFMLICSMQLGSLRRIVNINIRERQMKQELEEKNRILGFISAYDELSHLLNRRGFMEKAIQTIREQKGKQAYLLFADVDHLKEINDCFGHAAGDFAIKTAAEFLRQCMPADAVTARIGGDEFVSLIVADYEDMDCCSILTKRLEKYQIDFNKACDQPYYIELSVGLHRFVCDPKTDLLELLEKSDVVLYEQKKKRRTTVKKDV